MIEVRRLRVLRELAHHGTVAAAAQALHLTPSAVSQQLAALARETGVQLVEPSGRRLRLTDAGRLLLEHAHRVFAQIEEAEADLARQRAGTASAAATIRVGAFATALASLVAPAAKSLREQDPPITVAALEAEERACFAQLAEGDLDLAISVEFAGAPQPDNPRFFRQPLLVDRMDAAIPAGHPLASQPSVELSQLAGLPWVLGNPGSSCQEIIQVACAAAGFTPSATSHTSDWAAAAALVASGVAVTLIPRLAGSVVPPGARLVPLRSGFAARHVFAATRRGAQTAPALSAALAELRRVADRFVTGSGLPRSPRARQT